MRRFFTPKYKYGLFFTLVSSTLLVAADHAHKTRKPGRLLLLSGPSAAGKTTMIDHLKQKGYKTVVSHTTRHQREGETHGKNYYYIDEKEFQRMLDNNEFLVTLNFNNNKYGAERQQFTDLIRAGNNVVFDMDYSEIENVKKKMAMFLVIAILLLPPNLSILEKRLDQRKETPIGKETRMAHAKKVINHYHLFDALVVNETGQQQKAADQIDHLVHGDSSLLAQQAPETFCLTNTTLCNQLHMTLSAEEDQNILSAKL